MSVDRAEKGRIFDRVNGYIWYRMRSPGELQHEEEKEELREQQRTRARGSEEKQESVC